MIDLEQAENRSSSILFYGSRVSYFSLVSLKITPKVKGHSLSHATGFIVKNDSDYYLFSNWHVFSGRCSVCGQPLCQKTAGLPDSIEIRLHTTKVSENKSPPVYFEEVTVGIVTPQVGPVWSQHSNGQMVDVACVKLPELPANVVIAPLNTSTTLVQTDFIVGSDVYIVGYPETLKTVLELPTWKRGTIASELLPYEGKIFEFFVDAATRAGMSGAPILVRRNGGVKVADGKLVHIEEKILPLGVYSGRISSRDRFAEAIGRGWPIGFIDDLVFKPAPGSLELVDTSSETRRCSCKDAT